MVNYVMTAKVTRPLPVRFVAARDMNFTDAVYSETVIPSAEYLIAKGTIRGLEPDAEYFSRIEIGGRISSAITGRFRTPKAGPHSFSFGTASCAHTGSNALIFDNIRAKAEAGEIDFYIHSGDLHYLDIAENDPVFYHRGYDLVFNSPRQGAAWASMPMYYMWDNHDLGAGRGSRDDVNRPAAINAYRARVPTPPLGSSNPETAPYYSFVRGRVRFIVSDVRSERVDRESYPSLDPRQQVFFPEQKAWFFDQLMTAKAAGQVIIWVNTYPWVAPVLDSGDSWGGYKAAQNEIVDFITLHGMNQQIAIISGDMHALAYEDGTNAPGNLITMQAAAMDRPASRKGGPYTAGPFPPSGSAEVSQYGIIDVTDTGGASVGFQFRGINVDRSNGTETVLIDETFTLDVS